MKTTVIASSLFCLTAFGAQANIVMFDDFSHSDNLQLNGTAQIVNNGEQNVLRLTDALGQSGTAFLRSPISLADSSSFSSFFSFQITNNIGATDSADGIQGADGITFILQTNSNTAGASGGGIGYEGVDNSVAVEFDTWSNGQVDDDDGNHVGVNFLGSMDSQFQYNATTPFNNGAIWYSWVDYSGLTELFEVRFSESDTRPDSAVLSFNSDIGTLFGENDVFFGFGSGTGAAGGTHDILSASFANNYRPIGVSVPEPTGASLLLGGLCSMSLLRRRYHTKTQSNEVSAQHI